MGCWSIKKLNQFYETDIGKHIKHVINQKIYGVLENYRRKNNKEPSVLTCGYDILNSNYENTLKPQSMQDTYDIVIGYHCDELSFCIKDFSQFAFDHLKEKGICVLISSNGSGFCNDKRIPFCKYRSYKTIKALKRLHFKIIDKQPVLAYPKSMINSCFEKTYPIWNFVCKYICPSYAGAMMIVASKECEEVKPLFPTLHKIMTRADINKAYKQHPSKDRT